MGVPAINPGTVLDMIDLTPGEIDGTNSAPLMGHEESVRGIKDDYLGFHQRE